MVAGGERESLRGRLVDLLFIGLGQLLVRLARRVGGRDFGAAALHLLAEEEVVEVRGSPRSMKRYLASPSEQPMTGAARKGRADAGGRRKDQAGTP